MVNFENSTVGLVGFGVSNKAVFRYLQGKSIKSSIYISKNDNCKNIENPIIWDEGMEIRDSLIFRSPSIKPEKIKARGKVFTEIGFSLENSCGFKIGVTGSDGKTTTSTLICEILKGDFKTYLTGNIGVTLIDKIDLIKEQDIIVSELSSFQLCDMSPRLDVAVVTNISENHLDWHSNMLDYINAKRNILKNCKRAVLSYDCKYKPFFACKNTTYYSLCDLSCRVGDGCHYVYLKNDTVYYDKEPLFKRTLPILKGEYNLKNIMASIGACYPISCKEKIIEAVSTFRGVTCRCERIGEIEGVTFVDSVIDSTPERSISTISVFPKEKAILIMGGYDKNLSYLPLKPHLRDVKMVIVCGQNREKLLDACPRGSIVVSTLYEAVNIAYKNARPGDFVVLTPASASFDMYKNYKEKSRDFRKIVGDLNGKY